MKDRILMIDVESLGLHGPGFAVGYCWADFAGRIYQEGTFAVPPDSLRVDDIDAVKWVEQNVKIQPSEYNCRDLVDVRRRFWNLWVQVKERTLMFADCPWPVEARFLNSCVDDWTSRTWEGPYPLLDVVAVRLACILPSMSTEHRLVDELPAHHPLMDSRQSLRLLCEALEERPTIKEMLARL